MYKPVLFCDFDGTICFDRYWHSLPPETYHKIQKLLFDENKNLVNQWMRGAYTAEEVNRFIGKTLDIPFEYLWQVFIEDCRSMSVDQSVLNRLAALRARYRVILVTVNMDSFSRFTCPALELEKYFDRISNSYKEKVHKTDDGGKLFLDYALYYNAEISDCIAIDDNPQIIDIFKHLGGRGFHITPEKDISHYLSIIETSVS